MVIGSSWTSAGTSSTSASSKLAGFTATSGGNPDLKPLEANQFDAALEWYFAPTSELYVTLFKKDLSNYTTTEVHQQIIDGVPVAVSGRPMRAKVPSRAPSSATRSSSTSYRAC